MNIAAVSAPSAPADVFAAAEVFRINPVDIRVGDRIGLFWPDKAAALGALMARDGQSDPIKVVWSEIASGWQLVTGLHRLQGARAFQLPFINAIEVKGSDAELRRMEASENVHRRDFGPLERAMFIRAIADDIEARWADGYDGLSAQAIGQIRRWERDRAKAPGVERDEVLAASEAQASSAMHGGTYGWQEEAAESLGLSARSLQRSLMVHRRLIAPFDRDLVEQFATTPAGSNVTALDAIGRIVAVDARQRVIEAIVGNPALSVDQAIHIADGTAKPLKVRVTGDTKFMNNAGANLSRLSVAGWRSFAPTLVGMVKPSALPGLKAEIEARMRELGDAVMEGDDV